MDCKKEYLLLIEGSHAASSLFTEILLSKNFPHEIFVEKSGADLIAFLNKNSGHLPKLIIMELYLPDVHGCDLIEQINSKLSCNQIHFIVFASSISARDRERCENLGVNLCLIKPMELSDFELCINRIIEYWESQF